MASTFPPTIYIIAGPNGAGKTTFANSFLPEYVDCREFLNADLIAAGLSPFAPESQAVRASALMLERMDELVASRSTFGFETTLAARSYHGAVRRWQESGYEVNLFFLWLPSVAAAIDRVASRVRQGGHNIPENVIRRRYDRGMSNLVNLYLPILSVVHVFDGSCIPPRKVWTRSNGTIEVADQNCWNRILQQSGVSE